MMERWTIVGEVKWFNVARGFGFVVSDQVEEDILLHANILRNFGQNSISEGTRIEFEVQNSERGLQATRIMAILRSDASGKQSGSGSSDHPAESFLPARVKWFDPLRGFGFLNIYGDTRDIFVHIDVLRNSSMSELQPGEAISLRLGEGRRGLVAEEIRPWNSRIK